MDQARAAARIAFSRYDWMIVEDSGKRISGSDKKDSAETASTITVENGKILLRSEGYRLKDEGTRKESADYNKRWHSNLKVEFVTQLMKAEGQTPVA